MGSTGFVSAACGPEFSVWVDYDDPRWDEIDRRHYFYVDEGIAPEHFRHRRGARKVTMTYLTFSSAEQPTTQAVLTVMKESGLRFPTRADVESYFSEYPEERSRGTVVGFCGYTVQRTQDHAVWPVSACIISDRHGLILHWSWVDAQWFAGRRFLAVCE